MSMAGPAAGGAEEEAPLFQEINVTPLTDIFLVLLIIFMVTATGLSTGGIDVALPKAAVPGTVDAAEVVTVSIDAGKHFFLDKKEIAAEKLEAAIREALKSAKDKSVILAGDKDVPLESMVTLMEAARHAGALRFAVAVAREGDAGPGSSAPAAAKAQVAQRTQPAGAPR